MGIAERLRADLARQGMQKTAPGPVPGSTRRAVRRAKPPASPPTHNEAGAGLSQNDPLAAFARLLAIGCLRLRQRQREAAASAKAQEPASLIEWVEGRAA